MSDTLKLPRLLNPLAQRQLEAEAWARAKEKIASETDTYSLFRKKYCSDPVGFVHDCLDFRDSQGPTTYQNEIMAALPTERRVSVRGPHGLGKTAMAAWLILWFSLTRDHDTDWKIPTTASAWRQLTKYLWPEVRKWARRVKWDRIGRPVFSEVRELLSLNLKLESGEAFALTSSDVTSIEGAHASSLLYVFDEGKAIPDDIWDGAEGAFASPDTGEALAIAISTPGEPQGRFYEIHRRKPGLEDWWVRHVKLEEAIAADRIGKDWAEQRKTQWGEQSAVYQNRVLGEFATADEDAVIPLAWVERANELWEEWDKETSVETIGVDVARYGTDKTAIVLASGRKVLDIRYYSKSDTMETSGRVKGILDAHPGSKAVVDVVGVGAGVVDRLREMRCDVFAFGAGEKTDRRDKSGELGFSNKRSASWWMLRELLEDGLVALPPDDKLTGDLTAPKWRLMSGNRIQIESKDDIRKRINRSTDTADAVIMSLVGLELSETWLIW